VLVETVCGYIRMVARYKFPFWYKGLLGSERAWYLSDMDGEALFQSDGEYRGALGGSKVRIEHAGYVKIAAVSTI
jgi:hypothetical protein